MASADDIIEELNVRAQFLASSVAAGMCQPELQQAQVNAVLAKIQGVSELSVQAATSITEVITTGPWNEGQRVALASAISDAMMGKTSRPQGGKRCIQYVPSFELYLSEADIAFLEDNTNQNIDSKIQRIAERAWSLGLTCPSEALMKQITGIVVVLHLKDPKVSPSSKKTIMEAAKQNIKQLDRTKTHPLPHIASLPCDPTKLPADRKAFAYGCEGGPACNPIGDLAQCMASMATRQTHRSLRQEAAPIPQQALGSVSQQAMVQMVQATMQQTMRPILDCIQMAMSGQPQRQQLESPNIAFLPPRQIENPPPPPPSQPFVPLQDRPNAGIGLANSSVGEGAASSLGVGAGGSPALNKSTDPVSAMEAALKASAAAAADSESPGGAKGEAKAKAKGKGKAKSKAGPRASEASKAKANPTSKATTHQSGEWHSKSPMVKGCSQCRNATWGCKSCRPRSGIEVKGQHSDRKWRKV